MLRSSVVTIGNFDGLHLGHQALIQRCKDLAGTARPIAVVTFEPLPGAWFRPVAAPARLMSARQKLVCLDNEGIDLVWMMRFNQVLADMSAEDFISLQLVDVLDPVDVVVGEDFHYGKDRQGNINSLRQAGEKHGFGVNAVAMIEVDGDRVSSSSIRECLATGDLVQAARFLGGPYRTQSRIVRGRQLGRKLGYPTANMPPAAAPSPLVGVFAVRVRWKENEGNESSWHDGVANLGTRPAVGGEDFLVEVHIFDFDGDLYGRRMEVEYVKKLRNEEHFENINDLIKQMREDERLARECLGTVGISLTKNDN